MITNNNQFKRLNPFRNQQQNPAIGLSCSKGETCEPKVISRSLKKPLHLKSKSFTPSDQREVRTFRPVTCSGEDKADTFRDKAVTER